MRTLLPLVLVLVCCSAAAVALRNLSEIRYHFTTCETSDRNGPEASKCINKYMQGNSPIVHPENLLFQFEDRNDVNLFRGAQGFRVPRTGLYNVTVAGAAGGRGICSIDSGKGLVWKGQLNLSVEHNLLILVGQKGVGPCDIRPGIPACQNPPSSLNEISQCESSWNNWINNSTTGISQSLNQAYTGGGGGGGASVIRRQNRTDGMFEELPLVVAGGGGGTAAILSYDEIISDDFEIPFENINSITDVLYWMFINAKNTTRDLLLNSVRDGQRGFIKADVFNQAYRAGAGGGWSTLEHGAAVDGEFLSVQDSFALGGFDCARQLASEVQVAIEDVNGGFGGGGGQCGVEGAGGGYTGGSIFGASIRLPGGGGYSYLPSDGSDPAVAETTITSDGHGYVDLVPSNCGCTGVCAVMDDMFECICPIETSLAPDGFDCYNGAMQQVMTRTRIFLYPDEIVFTPLYFSHSVLLYGASATLVTGLVDIEVAIHYNDTQNTVLTRYEDIINYTSDESHSYCVLYFLDENANTVLESNVIRGHSGVANQFTNNVNGEYLTLLESPVLVSGALLLSHSGGCDVTGNQIELLASSIQPQQASELTEERILYAIGNGTYSELFETLNDVTTISNNTDSLDDPRPFYSLILIPFFAAILLGIILLVVLYKCVKHPRKNNDDSLNLNRPLTVLDTPYALMQNSCSVTVTNKKNSVTSDQVDKLPNEIFIKSEDIKLGKLVGEGEFGSVYKALLFENQKEHPKTVAVKTLKGFYSQRDVDELIRESGKMCHCNHPNVQTLIGVCMDGGPVPFIVMPFMENGCLLSYLRRNKKTFIIMLAQNSEDSTENEDESQAVTRTLTDMCFQIAKGMEYLVKNNVVHRDLAARNCMINEHRVICVSDFGLAENVYTKHYFRQENHTSVRLPLKWTAPESFNTGIFSEKSDVWSFGVTCWEVFSAGRIPYPGISPQSLPKLINNGHRMDKPENAACSDHMYDLMSQCWLSEADERPTFSVLVGLLEAELEAMSEYMSLMKSLDLGHNEEVVCHSPND